MLRATAARIVERTAPSLTRLLDPFGELPLELGQRLALKGIAADPAIVCALGRVEPGVGTWSELTQ